MKTLLYTFLILLLSRCGTEQGDPKLHDYSIVNNSGVNIELIPYYNGVKDSSRKISITNGNRIQKKLEVLPPYNYGLSMKSFFTSNNSASNITQLEVVFNNSKKTIYEDCPNLICSNNRNIFDKSHNDELVESYYVTSEDFNNSTNCNGNCY